MESTKIFAKNIRKKILYMAYKAKASHTAGCLSSADILAVLFNNVLQRPVGQNTSRDRDKFIMSKGHAAMVVYAILSEAGLLSDAALEAYCTDGSELAGHVSHSVPGIDASTGALGHGLSIACGIALADKRRGKPFKTYVLLGDGECNEGSIWEAAQFASQHRLNNLIAVVDFNKLQGYGRTADILEMDNLLERFKAFGWSGVHIDGHDCALVLQAFQQIPTERPYVIIADTIKGKGVAVMENDNLWHYRPPSEELYKSACEEVDNA